MPKTHIAGANLRGGEVRFSAENGGKIAENRTLAVSRHCQYRCYFGIDGRVSAVNVNAGV